MVIAMMMLMTIPWDPSADVVTLSASGFAAPGPTQTQVRPALALASGPGPTAGRLLRGDGQALPLALRDDQLITLPKPPLAVASSDSGLWALYDDQLIHHAPDGSAQLTTAHAAGVDLVGAADDAVWLVTPSEVIRYDASGAETTRAVWPMGAVAAASKSGVCGLTRARERALHCVAADGSVSTAPASRVGPFESLIAATASGLLTAEAGTLRHYTAGGVETLELQSAGLTAGGHPFLSGREGDALTIWTADSTRRLPLPEDAPLSLRVVAVDGDTALAWGDDLGLRYADGALSERLAVDDALHKTHIFPVAWRVDDWRAAAWTRDGLVLAASGPAGLLTTAIHWPPAL